jgi:hypothetical protein
MLTSRLTATAKKLVIVSGPEFGEMEGHILIISKALYGLWTSGLCWHDCFSECLCEMGLTPSKAKPDFGCGTMATTMSILQFMLMTLQ